MVVVLVLFGISLPPNVAIALTGSAALLTAVVCVVAAWFLSTVFVLVPGFALRVRSIWIYTQVVRFPFSKMASPTIEYHGADDTGVGTVRFGGRWHFDTVLAAQQAYDV